VFTVNRIVGVLLIALPLSAEASDSSWNNIKILVRDPYGHYQVILRDGPCTAGRITTFDSDSDSVTVVHRESVTILRSDIVRIVRVSKQGDTLYSGTPQAWPYLLDASTTARARLYDSSIPEDNAFVACRPVP